MIALQQKGGSSENNNLENAKKKEIENKIVRIEYIDHVLVCNSDPTKYKPIVREAIGRIVQETSEYIVLIWEQSLMYRRQVNITPESGMILVKKLVLGVWILGCQTLRS